MDSIDTKQIAGPIPQVSDTNINIKTQLGHIPPIPPMPGGERGSYSRRPNGGILRILGIIAILFVVGILGILVAIFLQQNDDKEGETTEEETKETVMEEEIYESLEWPTYKHFDYGFEIKYPDSYIISSNGKDEIIISNSESDSAIFIQSMISYELDRYESHEEFLSARILGDKPVNYISSEKLKLDQGEYTRYKLTDNFGKEIEAFILEDQTNIYIFSIQVDEFSKETGLKNEDKKNFYTIVNSFEESEAPDYSDYNDFANSRVNLNYPQNWELIESENSVSIIHKGPYEKDDEKQEDSARVTLYFTKTLELVANKEGRGQFAYFSTKRFPVSTSSTLYKENVIPGGRAFPEVKIEIAKTSFEEQEVEKVDESRTSYSIKEYQEIISQILMSVRFKEEQVTPEVNNRLDMVVDLGICLSEDSQIEELIQKFTNRHRNKDQTVLSLFTSPSTESEKSTLNTIESSPEGMYSISALSYDTQNIDVVSKSLKYSNGCLVNLVEQRKSAEREFEVESRLVLEKSGENWLIDKYIVHSPLKKEGKYSGFGF